MSSGVPNLPDVARSLLKALAENVIALLGLRDA